MGRRSAEAWRALFEAQARSGLTVKEFCRKRGLSERSFLLRKKVLGQGSPTAAPSPFVRVEAASAVRSETLEHRVRLRVGRCEWELSGFAVGDIIRLVQALA